MAEKIHLGIIGCSAEGAALCYRTFCTEAEKRFGTYQHPEVSIHNYSLAEYMVHIDRMDWAEVAKLMLGSMKKLAATGANLFVCPDNTIHEAWPYLFENESDKKQWLHIAEVVGATAKKEGYERIGVLGTRYLMEGPVYQEALTALGLESVIPKEADRALVNRVIFEELVRGILKDSSRSAFNEIIGHLKNEGCQAVVLGCTEVPLLVDPKTSPLPTLDSTRLLARAAIERADAQS